MNLLKALHHKPLVTTGFEEARLDRYLVCWGGKCSQNRCFSIFRRRPISSLPITEMQNFIGVGVFTVRGHAQRHARAHVAKCGDAART